MVLSDTTPIGNTFEDDNFMNDDFDMEENDENMGEMPCPSKTARIFI